jgi:hypothetical protein
VKPVLSYAKMLHKKLLLAKMPALILQQQLEQED